MATKHRRAIIEWIGGVLLSPAYVTGEGAPYRPEALFWMGADGAVLGHAVGRPGELVGLIADSLRSTIAQPMSGPPHAPHRLRIDSPVLAAALRAALPAIEVVCAPTPEVNSLFAAMEAGMAGHAEAEATYLAPGVAPAAMGGLFQAAAALYRAQPWRIVPGDACLTGVTIPALGVTELVMCVIGQQGQSLGLLLFQGPADFEAFVAAGRAMDDEEMPVVPPHISLNFEPAAELGARRRKEVKDHRWEVAGPQAYPWLAVMEADLVARPPSAGELTLVEVIARALPAFLTDAPALERAWSGEGTVVHTTTVRTHEGPLDVTLRAPHPGRASSTDVLAELRALAGPGIRDEVRRPLELALLREFVASPESRGLAGLTACHVAMDLAADYLHTPLVLLDAPALRELLFELVPFHALVEAPEAGQLIDELRALYAFLGRAHGLPQAAACKRALGPAAVKRLATALADPRTFGPVKAQLVAGRAAGHDMSTPAGIAAWLNASHAASPPPRRAPARKRTSGPKRPR